MLGLQAYLGFEILKTYIFNEPPKSLFRTGALIEVNNSINCLKNLFF